VYRSVPVQSNNAEELEIDVDRPVVIQHSVAPPDGTAPPAATTVQLLLLLQSTLLASVGNTSAYI